uniref:Uncharacterized protein n=1 Tax=Oryza sativa subsp. japonica TaxID=39947 RepID=Q6YTR5_ORYSJ|nr:hypothetical protein [Oryza sativa Japonica Group]BAD10726.1 hypothetical protein [Oryza sativa Japonica Group]
MSPPPPDAPSSCELTGDRDCQRREVGAAGAKEACSDEDDGDERERDGCSGDDNNDMLMDTALHVGLVAPRWRPGRKRRSASNSGQRARRVEGKSGAGDCISSHSGDPSLYDASRALCRWCTVPSPLATGYARRTNLLRPACRSPPWRGKERGREVERGGEEEADV